MRYVYLLLTAVLVLVGASHQASAAHVSAHSVVRISSHGASGTIIATAKDKTYILSCAHAFQGKDRLRPIKLDVPMRGQAPLLRGKIQLLAVKLDERAGIDLSLILLPAGPMPYCAPVAPAGHRLGKDILSIGYDKMVAVSVKVPTRILGTDTVTYTRERPVPGRSGGALLDVAKGYVVGVVIGYEVTGPRRGLYVSHATILRFLRTVGQPSGPAKGLPLCPPSI